MADDLLMEDHISTGDYFRMIKQVGSGASLSSPATDQAATKKDALDVSSADFLTLLTAQLQYQDPFAAKDPSQDLQQLATLAQLSTLKNIEASLQDLVAAQKSSATSATPSDEQLSTLKGIESMLKTLLGEHQGGTVDQAASPLQP